MKNFYLCYTIYNSILESGRCWVTCLRYGLATNLIIQYHPIFMRHLTYFITHLSMTDDPKASKFNYHFAVVILEIINAAIYCAPNHEEIFLLEDKIFWCKKCDPLDVLVVESPTQGRQEELAPPHLPSKKGFL